MNLLINFDVPGDRAKFFRVLPTSKVPAAKVFPLAANQDLKLKDSKLMMGSTPCDDFRVKCSLFIFVECCANKNVARQKKCYHAIICHATAVTNTPTWISVA